MPLTQQQVYDFARDAKKRRDAVHLPHAGMAYDCLPQAQTLVLTASNTVQYSTGASRSKPTWRQGCSSMLSPLRSKRIQSSQAGQGVDGLKGDVVNASATR